MTENKTAAVLLVEAQNAVIDLNKVIAEDRHSEIKTKRKAVSETIDAVNAAYRKESNSVFLATENPFLSAVTTGYVDCIRLNVTVDKTTKQEVASIEDAEEVVDLRSLESDCKDRKLANNGQWVYWMEKFTFVMAARVNSDLGLDSKKFKDMYKMSKEARDCDIGATPTSNTQILKQLQEIIDGILFIDNGENKNMIKALTKDVAFIRATMTRHGKERMSVSMPRTGTMIKLVTEVIHRIVTNAEYTAEYEIVK